MLMSIISYFSCIIDLPNKLTESKCLKACGGSCSSPGAEETGNIYSIFRLSNRLFVCLFV